MFTIFFYFKFLEQIEADDYKKQHERLLWNWTQNLILLTSNSVTTDLQTASLNSTIVYGDLGSMAL